MILAESSVRRPSAEGRLFFGSGWLCIANCEELLLGSG